MLGRFAIFYPEIDVIEKACAHLLILHAYVNVV
jgi:hypothetical protein